MQKLNRFFLCFSKFDFTASVFKQRMLKTVAICFNFLIKLIYRWKTPIIIFVCDILLFALKIFYCLHSKIDHDKKVLDVRKLPSRSGHYWTIPNYESADFGRGISLDRRGRCARSWDELFAISENLLWANISLPPNTPDKRISSREPNTEPFAIYHVQNF